MTKQILYICNSCKEPTVKHFTEDKPKFCGWCGKPHLKRIDPDEIGFKHEQDCLFDIDEYKKSEVLYQVRHIKGETDTGEVIATFKELDHTKCMKGLDVPEGELIVVQFTKGQGVTDIYGQGYDL